MLQWGMKIDQAELARRLGSSKNLVTTLSNVQEIPCEVDTVEKPSQERATKLSIATKITAGSLAKQGVNVQEIAREFGLSKNQVINAKNSKRPEIKGPITNSLERVRDLAIDKMMCAMGLMTIEKFEEASLKDLSIISANMSRVIEKTQEKTEDATKIQLVIYTPEPRVEGYYRVIDV